MAERRVVVLMAERTEGFDDTNLQTKMNRYCTLMNVRPAQVWAEAYDRGCWDIAEFFAQEDVAKVLRRK